MYPPLLDSYVKALQLERENEVMRLSEEARFLREATAIIPSRSKVNLRKLLKIFNRERFRQGEALPVSIQSSADGCTTSKPVQCQLC